MPHENGEALAICDLYAFLREAAWTFPEEGREEAGTVWRGTGGGVFALAALLPYSVKSDGRVFGMCPALFKVERRAFKRKDVCERRKALFPVLRERFFARLPCPSRCSGKSSSLSGTGQALIPEKIIGKCHFPA